MLYREIIAVCSEIHTKHINTVCGQNVELLSVKPGRERSNHEPIHSVVPKTKQAQRRCYLPTVVSFSCSSKCGTQSKGGTRQ